MMNLEHEFLKIVLENKQTVAIYLINGICLQGKITAFDEKVLVLDAQTGQAPLSIYRHAIATVQPKTASRSSRFLGSQGRGQAAQAHAESAEA